jgi:hypothetical protein
VWSRRCAGATAAASTGVVAAAECTTAALPRPPLSTPTNCSHARSPIRRSKNAISPPPLLTPSHALHELSAMPSPPPTLPSTDRWVIGPQGRPVAPSTRTGLLLKRSISHVPASADQRISGGWCSHKGAEARHEQREETATRPGGQLARPVLLPVC